MKYLLLHNMDEISKNIFLKSYIDDGFKITSVFDNSILIKKDAKSIIDEDIYIKVLRSYLKRSEVSKKCTGKIIDLTDAFKYASSKNGFDKFDNRFEWYIKNRIMMEINN